MIEFYKYMRFLLTILVIVFTLGRTTLANAREIPMVLAETLTNGYKIYTSHGVFTHNIVLPAVDDFVPLLQNPHQGACALYSILGAALQVSGLRKILEKTLVRQDAGYVYFQFPKPDIPETLKQVHGALLTANAAVYQVKKELHHGDLLPGTHPWINMFSKAYYEYLHQAGLGAHDSYEMLTFRGDGVPFNLLFGVAVTIISMDHQKIKVQSVAANHEANGKLVLQQNGKIAGMVDPFGVKASADVDAKSDVILVLPRGGHSRSAYFQPNRGWEFFDNQDHSGSRGGNHALLEKVMNDSDYVQVIDLSN